MDATRHDSSAAKEAWGTNEMPEEADERRRGQRENVRRRRKRYQRAKHENPFCVMVDSTKCVSHTYRVVL